MVIGVIGAMHEEVVELKALMVVERIQKIAAFEYYVGSLNGKKIVLVESGIGKVNSSVCTTILINSFNVDKIVFTGVAGAVSRELNIGDVVVSTNLIEHDFDCSAFGMKPGVIPRMECSTFKADDSLINIGTNAVEKVLGNQRVKVGVIVSGDQFIADKNKIKWLEETFDAQCTEMEGASVAHVAYLFNIPFVVLRAISDKSDGSAHMDFPKFVQIAAKNSKDVVVEMLKHIS